MAQKKIWRSLEQGGLPQTVEDDLLDLTPLEFQLHYRVRPPSWRESYVESEDVFDLPKISAQKLDSLGKTLGGMSVERIVRIVEDISTRDRRASSSSITSSRQRFLNLVARPRKDNELERVDVRGRGVPPKVEVESAQSPETASHDTGPNDGA